MTTTMMMMMMFYLSSRVGGVGRGGHSFLRALVVVVVLVNDWRWFFADCLLSRDDAKLLNQVPWGLQCHDATPSGGDMTFFFDLGKASISSSNIRAKAGRKQERQERQEYLCLQQSQRDSVHKAMAALKSVTVGKYSAYDIFVIFHDGDKSPSAHHGPSFILWHRFFIYMFELAMGRYFRGCTLPYWDNRLLSRSVDNPRHSVLFTPALFGEAVGEVKTGIAGGFKTLRSSACLEISQSLTRAIPNDTEGLFDEQFAAYISSAGSYQDLCSPWNETFEEVHGGVHMFIGQLMAYLACSPNDPLFFLHHSFVDYLYETHFRQRHQQQQRQRQQRNGGSPTRSNLTYPDVSQRDDIGDMYAGESVMMPFGILHEEMLNDDSFVPAYSRSPGDVECARDEDCCSNGNAEFLWCQPESRLCAAKIQEGGVVREGFPSRACYCKPPKLPSVVAGRCRCP